MIDLKTENLLIHKEVNENLESILKRKAFSNGYIFYGPEGIGTVSYTHLTLPTKA